MKNSSNDISETSVLCTQAGVCNDTKVLHINYSAQDGDIQNDDSSSNTQPCQGIDHFLVWTYLCSTKMPYAYMRGMALTKWKYDNEHQTWHALQCTTGFVALQRGRISCDACYSVQNKIRKETHPWLFESKIANNDNFYRTFDHNNDDAKEQQKQVDGPQ